ncbi:MAG: hypothetical protein GEV07_07905 [Streptosporangiales bacterium]|nr:hypothetical protein [Streptosporangiales bacterium]
MGLQDLLNKAKRFARGHKDQSDETLTDSTNGEPASDSKSATDTEPDAATTPNSGADATPDRTSDGAANPPESKGPDTADEHKQDPGKQ